MALVGAPALLAPLERKTQHALALAQRRVAIVRAILDAKVRRALLVQLDATFGRQHEAELVDPLVENARREMDAARVLARRAQPARGVRERGMVVIGAAQHEQAIGALEHRV